MAHPEQRKFFEDVKDKFPSYFDGQTVLDYGSLNVNGSLKDLFQNGQYTGIDLISGDNVDIVSLAHSFKGEPVDVVVSAEMLEHDEHFEASLDNMYKHLREGGLMVLSAAGLQRAEHGTTRTTGTVWGTSSDYYRNITLEDVKSFVARCPFKEHVATYNPSQTDIYFWGIK